MRVTPCHARCHTSRHRPSNPAGFRGPARHNFLVRCPYPSVSEGGRILGNFNEIAREQAGRGDPEMSASHLNQRQLADRWGVSTRTLEGWRWRGEGPTYLKLGGRVVYRLEDVQQFEAQHLHTNTVGPLGSGAARNDG